MKLNLPNLPNIQENSAVKIGIILLECVTLIKESEIIEFIEFMFEFSNVIDHNPQFDTYLFEIFFTILRKLQNYKIQDTNFITKLYELCLHKIRLPFLIDSNSHNLTDIESQYLEL